MRFRQIIASALTVMCLCTCFSTTVSAKTVSTFSLVNSISPLYDIADSAYSELNIVGTKAECVSKVSGDNTTKITVEQTLQKYSGWFWIWDDVDGASWTRTENKSSVNLSNTKSGLTSGTYRVKSMFTLTDKNGKTETLTIYSDEVSVN
ncbi:MAG TPA: hypothetical protein DDX91_05075 [Ruminococcaceae bacterium]|nr:hypothetical protein [Oscillospiraceae bacterium]